MNPGIGFEIPQLLEDDFRSIDKFLIYFIRLSIWLRSTQHVVGHGRDLGADPQQRLERRHRRAAAVEAERELVQVGLKMLLRDAVMRSQEPCLEVGDGSVRVAQHLRRVLRAFHGPDAVLVARLLQPFVAAPPVGVDRTAGLDGPLDERHEAPGADIGKCVQSDPSARPSADLHCHRDGRLRLHLAADHVFLLAADVRVVDLDLPAKLLPIRVDRGPSQLVEHRPRGLIARKAELAFELESRYPRRQRRHEVRRAEPLHERRTRRVHDRTCGHGDLIPARLALVEATARQAEGPLAPATRAGKAIGPAALHQISSTRLLGREPRLELRQRFREARTRHAQTLHVVPFGVKWISVLAINKVNTDLSSFATSVDAVLAPYE